MSTHYPFAAVVGQDRLKTALLLAAVDPALGGVLIEGPRGTAKSTVARGLADLLPGGRERFVTLPLGATEERVIGTLNLEKALRDGEIDFSPGLLYAAHEGILYVDEVNLLPDHLVDLLLDVAASGINIVERDGLSHEHPARIVLIGTMNPDEGALRPQLLDRFGLGVPIGHDFTLSERVEIARRRLAFDDDPMSFAATFAEQHASLAARIERARRDLAQVAVGEAVLERISVLCDAAGVEGVRADIVMLRAARAHAAWQGGAEVAEEDIEQVAELALHHRRREHAAAPVEAAAPFTRAAEQPADAGGDWGEMPPVPVETGPGRVLELEKKKHRS